MKIQIFQHLPDLPKAGIFCPSPILCVAFRTFIPDRSVFHCFPLSCLSMFRPLVSMHKSAHPVTHPAAPPSHAPATPDHHTRQSQCNPLHTPAPTAPLPAQATRRQRQGAAHPPPALYSLPRPQAALSHHTHQFTAHSHTPAPAAPLPTQAIRRQHQGQRTRTRRYTAYCFSKPHTPAKKPPPPHTQASKKDCPAQEQSFL